MFLHWVSDYTGPTWVTTATHLNKGRHVRLLHGPDGRLHQRHGALQLLAVAPDERSSSFEFVVLLLADEPHQLLFALLQGRHQAVKMAGQLLALLLPILLRSEVRGWVSRHLTRILPAGSPL